MWSLKCYFGVYCPCCFATQKRHTKIRLGIYHSPASQCKWKFGRVSGKQAWASGILYRLYKKLPSLGECRKFLVSQPENNILACVMTQTVYHSSTYIILYGPAIWWNREGLTNSTEISSFPWLSSYKNPVYFSCCEGPPMLRDHTIQQSLCTQIAIQ